MTLMNVVHTVVTACVSTHVAYLYREDSDDKGEITTEYQQRCHED